MAEVQVAKLAAGGAEGKSTVVSVKSSVSAGQKRKADESSSAEEKKSARRSIKKAKR